MAKLWAKNYDLDATMEAFTVGRDYILDMELVEADILGNLAHSAMLEKIGVMSNEERLAARKAFLEILEEHKAREVRNRPLRRGRPHRGRRRRYGKGRRRRQEGAHRQVA